MHSISSFIEGKSYTYIHKHTNYIYIYIHVNMYTQSTQILTFILSCFMHSISSFIEGKSVNFPVWSSCSWRFTPRISTATSLTRNCPPCTRTERMPTRVVSQSTILLPDLSDRTSVYSHGCSGDHLYVCIVYWIEVN